MKPSELLKTGLSAVVLTWVVGSWARAEDEKKSDAKDERVASADLEIGKPVPDFALKSYDGKEGKLADHKDKIVVLEWFNKDCPFCQQYGETMKALATKYADKGVVWWAVDSTHFRTAEENAEFAKTKEVKYPILSDFDGKVGRQYRAATTPHLFVIHKGELAYRGAIASKDDKNYVEEAIEALLAGKPIATTKTKSFG